jgi:hypothetical protein
VARDGADEPRLARIVAKRAAQRADRLRQRAVRDDDVAPDAIENLAPMNGVASSFDEEDQQIEIAGDQRELLTVADQQPLPRREGEVTEPVARHGEPQV